MAWKNVQYENGKYRTNEGGGGGGSSTFAGLDDVNFSNIQNGQVPKYNSTTQKWENADESGGGGTVTDVKVDGQSVVDPQTGEADITMPTIPVEDVEVNGESVVDANKVAQIKSYKEVTQSEYNALPDSKLNDGILYAIKDVGGSDGFPPLIYSDEEREVGVWRDGKPLYEITVRCESNGDTPHNISNIDKVIEISGRIIRNTGVCIKVPTYNSTEYYGYIVVNLSTVYVYISGANWIPSSSQPCYVTIWYTKTTDTAGSGAWTTQGGYAHHYSTTEQVIGTWIDGKPLYEITVSDNTERDGSVSSEQTIYVNVPNIKEFIAISGFASFGENTQWLPITFSDAVGNSLTNSRVKLIALNIGSTRFSVRFDIGNNYNGNNKISKVRFTVRYTKTTD